MTSKNVYTYDTKMIFFGSKYPNNNKLNFDNRSTGAKRFKYTSQGSSEACLARISVRTPRKVFTFVIKNICLQDQNPNEHLHLNLEKDPLQDSNRFDNALANPTQKIVYSIIK